MLPTDIGGQVAALLPCFHVRTGKLIGELEPCQYIAIPLWQGAYLCFHRFFDPHDSYLPAGVTAELHTRKFSIRKYLHYWKRPRESTSFRRAPKEFITHVEYVFVNRDKGGKFRITKVY